MCQTKQGHSKKGLLILNEFCASFTQASQVNISEGCSRFFCLAWHRIIPWLRSSHVLVLAACRELWNLETQRFKCRRGIWRGRGKLPEVDFCNSVITKGTLSHVTSMAKAMLVASLANQQMTACLCASSTLSSRIFEVLTKIFWFVRFVPCLSLSLSVCAPLGST